MEWNRYLLSFEEYPQGNILSVQLQLQTRVPGQHYSKSKELFSVWKTRPKNYSMFGKPVQRIIQCGFCNNSDIILIALENPSKVILGITRTLFYRKLLVPGFRLSEVSQKL